MNKNITNNEMIGLIYGFFGVLALRIVLATPPVWLNIAMTRLIFEFCLPAPLPLKITGDEAVGVVSFRDGNAVFVEIFEKPKTGFS
ncbi:hypothetical protein [Calothrix sp. CCY 0018]|uniref:hypothetical protein n=1 Tax=Calothrix sp. CCY 0018 TaxID=3103864 RepID=UPI0039C70010